MRTPLLFESWLLLLIWSITLEAMFVASIRYGLLVEGLGGFFFDDFFGDFFGNNFLEILLPRELFAYATKTRTVRAGNFMIDRWCLFSFLFFFIKDVDGVLKINYVRV